MLDCCRFIGAFYVMASLFRFQSFSDIVHLFCLALRLCQPRPLGFCGSVLISDGCLTFRSRFPNLKSLDSIYWFRLLDLTLSVSISVSGCPSSRVGFGFFSRDVFSPFPCRFLGLELQVSISWSRSLSYDLSLLISRRTH